MSNSVLVIFTSDLSKKSESWWHRFKTVVAPQRLSGQIPKDIAFVNIDDFIEAGNIYEASDFINELPHLKFADGLKLPKSIIYKGYELWWMHHNGLFQHFCLPYTQHKKLLEYLKNFEVVYLYQPPHKSLFSYYLESYGCKIHTLRQSGFKTSYLLPFGIFLQISITLISLPILILKRIPLLVFIGDKFEKSKDYDFRMRFIYKELRVKSIPFVEFIRSLESWRKVLQHAFTRRRPVIYSEAIVFTGRFMGAISSGNVLAKRKFGPEAFASERNPETRFKLLIATHYLQNIYDDIWAIRIMKWILPLIGIKAGLFTAALDRNFHTVFGCKLNNIPTVGILHGVASRYYNVYDFLPGFDGQKMLSVDKYGLWSDWWKEYYEKNSDAYCPEQLYVSGPMRPLEKENTNVFVKTEPRSEPVRVLFISEQLAVPSEILPYLGALLKLPKTDFVLSFRFRPYRDGFKDWLLKNRPGFLEQDNITIAKDGLQDAIKDNDVVIGSHSTAVIEALFQYRVPVLLKTQKWGDYYSLNGYDKENSFFAENPKELVEKIKKARSISVKTLKDLQERYFGDLYKNGSKWVVDQIEEVLSKKESE